MNRDPALLRRCPACRAVHALAEFKWAERERPTGLTVQWAVCPSCRHAAPRVACPLTRTAGGEGAEGGAGPGRCGQPTTAPGRAADRGR